MPHLLTQHSQFSNNLGSLGPAMKVCLTFGFLGMLRQSNLAPSSATAFNLIRHSCRGNVILGTSGILLIVCCTKTIQVVGSTPCLLIPSIPDHLADPVGDYKHLLALSTTTSSNQPLLTFNSSSGMVMVTVHMLVQALNVMCQELGVDSSLYSLHSLGRGGASATYRGGAEQMQIKRHELWSLGSFWDYVTSTCVHRPPVACALAGCLAAT